MNLEELKTQNKAKEDAVKPDVEPVVEDVKPIEDIKPDVPLEDDVDDDDAKPLEPWQMSEMDEAKGQPDKDVPVKTHLKIKSKLKGRLSEAEDKNKALADENARLKAKGPAPKPDRVDFATDDEYDAAHENYEDLKTTERVRKVAEQDRVTLAQKNAIEARKKAVESHYKRAAELVEKSGIKAELFGASDKKVRETVEMVYKGGGDDITDQLIDDLGDGSEKVLYYLGINENALNKLQVLLASQRSGMKAGMYLAQLKERLTKPKKVTSTAPAPANQHNGDGGATASSKAVKKLKKAYDDAHKSGNPQDAYNAKKAAKLAKVDVSQW